MLPALIAIGLACMALERAAPGWKLPSVRGWWPRVLGINLVQVGVVLLAGVTWERALSGWSLVRLSASLNATTAGLTAYVIATFVFYWWHRLRHEHDFFWRGFHQIHHSPQRLELITSFYKHPLEMVANSIIGSVLIYTVLGLDLKAGAIYTTCTALGEFFYHTNVTTPRWVGFIFQRPEMHRIHHEHGKHRSNYGDLVIWDMLFGTYHNPPTFEASCGFDAAKEQRLADMLRFRDVHR
jgi:sterol desaturase/sphingolipid hydroxylase (fatty acid hydroxylase superfamily)